MGNQTVRTVLDALVSIAEVPAAALTQRVKRAVAEQTVEAVRVRTRMAGKIFTFPVAEKFVMLLCHI